MVERGDERAGDVEPAPGLPGFRAPAAAQGLSLDQLNHAFAQMLSTGQDPYAASLAASAGPSVPDVPVPPAPEADADVDAHCETTPRSILESLLFVGNADNRPLSATQVAGLMRGVRPAEIDELVRDLNRDYEANRCPYRIASEGAGYRLVLRDEYHGLRDKFLGRVQQARLSQAAIEVLSLVAYHTTLTRDEIVKLRGKPSGGVLAQLVRRQLLSMEHELENPRVARYRPTQRFLHLFGLSRLEELPRSQELETR